MNLLILISFLAVLSLARGATIQVKTSKDLAEAFLKAKPGDTISLADGTYTDSKSKFTVSVSGTASKPITLTGSRKAVLSTGDVSKGYGLYLNKANYWLLEGFSVKKAQKGIVLDSSNSNVITNVAVSDIGQEAVHFRCSSSDNTIQNSEISRTGRASPNKGGDGEAVYIGTAISNWPEYECLNNGPDNSHRNKVLYNKLGPDVTAECVDIKEGTRDGLVQGNTFDGNALSGELGAISWVNCKGTNYKIIENKGKNALKYGFRVRIFYISQRAKYSKTHK